MLGSSCSDLGACRAHGADGRQQWSLGYAPGGRSLQAHVITGQSILDEIRCSRSALPICYLPYDACSYFIQLFLFHTVIFTLIVIVSSNIFGLFGLKD